MDVESKAQLLRVVAHPTRLRIIERLAAEAEPLCASDPEPDLGIPQPNLSQPLAALRGAAALDSYVRGRRRRSFLTDPGLAVLIALLDAGAAAKPPSTTCCSAHEE